MKRSRQFRPAAPAELEERVVLSHFALIPQHSTHIKNPTTVVESAAQLALTGPTKGSVGFFSSDIAGTIKAGQPVFEEITTTFSNGTTQNENRLIVPDPGTGTITTTRTINLRGGGGFEKITDVATTKGSTTTHNETTVLPNGSFETTIETDLVKGNKTLTKGTVYLPGGSTETYTATVTTSGNLTTTDKTITEPDGSVNHYHIVTTSTDEFSSSSTATDNLADGTTATSKSITNILRLTPPT
jgi:hypothetical protein